MQPMQWSMQQIKQCKKETGQAMLSDEHTLVSFSQDFGKIIQSSPAVVCSPDSTDAVQALLNFANQQSLPVTLRCKGLSQGGQALPMTGGLTLNFEKFNQVLAHEEESIWVEANSSWADLLAISLKNSQRPPVLPYNCNLSIAGVLSAGGVGASSFKYGTISSHVKALEVVTAAGELQLIDDKSSLFHACLSGQGRYAAITKACIKLKPCLANVRTFFLVYLDKDQWLADLKMAEQQVDYIEAFCSPSLQGVKSIGGKTQSFAEWLYVLHLSKEYESMAPELASCHPSLKPWKTLYIQDDSIHAYLHRHNCRFEAMKLTGQWELSHPWYECFIPMALIATNLKELLTELPLHYVSLLHVVPISSQAQRGLLMLPDAQDICSLMILHPGIHSSQVQSCLQAIETLDRLFLRQGGKRYLSGYLGTHLQSNYWQQHFGHFYKNWVSLKQEYDPKQILGSYLYQDVSAR